MVMRGVRAVEQSSEAEQKRRIERRRTEQSRAAGLNAWEGMSTSHPVPSLLDLSIDVAAANIDKLPSLASIPDHIVAILFEKTLEASKLNDSNLKMFLASGNSWVQRRVKSLGIKPTRVPVLPTTCSGRIL